MSGGTGENTEKIGDRRREPNARRVGKDRGYAFVHFRHLAATGALRVGGSPLGGGAGRGGARGTYGGLDHGELGLTAAMFDPPAGLFLVARTENWEQPVGGVGLRIVATAPGEVRRLWVDPAWRGRGVGRDLMAAIEKAAGGLGLAVLRIETGDRQPEAVSLCQSLRWERIFVTPEGAPLPTGWIRFRKIVG